MNTAVVLLLLLIGCGASPTPETLPGTELKTGADLTRTDFGVSPDLAPSFAAFAQAASDITSLAAGTRATFWACSRQPRGLLH